MINTEFNGLYQVEGDLAKSRKAWIYRARHVETGQPAAIKVLRPCSLPGEKLEARFEREFHVLRTLNHPNIVRVFQTGLTSNGLLYFAMELVNGETLGQRIERMGAMLPTTVIPYLDQIAHALDAAHQLGIVHRDINPNNILLHVEPDGRETVKVLDFGLAKVIQVANEGETSDMPASPGITADGVSVGTPGYMSPEQVKGVAVEPRSDIYSLGATLYTLLTARPPFVKPTDFETMVAHVTEEPPPFPNRTGLAPSAVEIVVMEAMAKSPDQRPATAGELARRFRQATQSGTVASSSLGHGSNNSSSDSVRRLEPVPVSRANSSASHDSRADWRGDSRVSSGETAASPQAHSAGSVGLAGGNWLVPVGLMVVGLALVVGLLVILFS